jgi:RecA/RadA recombinase
MDLLEYEPELPPSTQAVKASTLFQKAQQAAAYQVGDAGLDALFAAEDAANIGLPANHVLEVSAAPGLGKTRWCMMFAVSALLDATEPREVLFVGKLALSRTLRGSLA